MSAKDAFPKVQYYEKYYEDKPTDSTMDLDEIHDAAHDDKASNRSATNVALLAVWSAILAFLMLTSIATIAGDPASGPSHDGRFDEYSDVINFESPVLPLHRKFDPKKWLDGPRADFLSIFDGEDGNGGGGGRLNKVAEAIGMKTMNPIDLLAEHACDLTDDLALAACITSICDRRPRFVHLALVCR